MNWKRYRALGILGLAGLLLNCGSKASPTKEITSQRSNDLIIALVNETGGLVQGQNRFVIAFRSAATDQPVDVGRVSVSSTMPMPGMPMSAGIELSPAGEVGKYLAKGDFSMSGGWNFEVRWDGSMGQGTTLLSTNVR
jgi:YtkA-like protein